VLETRERVKKMYSGRKNKERETREEDKAFKR